MRTLAEKATYMREYYAKNIEQCRKNNKESGRRNSEKRSLYYKKWRLSHIQQERDNKQRWNLQHPLEKYKRDKNWSDNHVVQCRAARRRYYASHKKEVRSSIKKWCLAHRAECNAHGMKRRTSKKYSLGSGYTTSEHIKLRWEMWGNRCYLCGDRATATDHVIPLSKGGAHLPANLRPICKTCNSKKGAKSLKEYLLIRSKSNV